MLADPVEREADSRKSGGMNLSIAQLHAGDNCDFFRNQRDYEAEMLRRVNWIIFGIATAVAVSLVILVAAAAVGEWPLSAAAAIGAIGSGSAMKFIFDQRIEHQQRVERWIQAIDDAGCPPVS